MSVCGTTAAARQSRCEPAPYAALPPELLDTIPKRVFIESDNWTGRRAWNALRQRHTVCVTAEDVAEAEAAATVQRWSPPRSISPPELCCQTAAVRARILHWDSLAAAGLARPPSPPRPPRLKKRHTIAGARHSRPARPAVSAPVSVSVSAAPVFAPAMGGAGGRSVGAGGASVASVASVSSGSGGGGGPTPTVLVQTWEARRSSIGAPVVLAPDSDEEGSVSSEGDWTADVQVHSVATQTVHSSRVVRRVPVGSNEVYMVQVCEPTHPANGGAPPQQTHTAVTVHLPRQKQQTTTKQTATTKQIVTTLQGQPPKPPRMLNIESGLDFTRDPPSFSSLHSAASSEGSQGGGSGGGGGGSGGASGNGSGRLHEAINHDLVLAHEAARRNVLELRSGSVGTEAETVLRELDRALDSHGSTAAVDRAGAGQHGFSSEFAAQMARESGGLARPGGKAGEGGRERSESTSPQRRETRTPESGSRSLDSEELSLDSRTRSPEQPPPLSPADARLSSPRSAPSPARPPRRGPARHSTSPTDPSTSPDASYTSHSSHLPHSSSAPPQSITSHDPASFTHHPSAARRVSNTENFNLVEEITDGSRSVLARSEDFESLSSGGYDMGDVGVTRMQTPSTPRATPTSSPAPRLESPVYATPDRVPRRPQHAVVVAIDFGTTYSGYAFSFASEPASIHVMRKAGGDDPGLNNQKTATALLLTPQADFSAFGFSARVAYHDLEPDQAAEWLYFDKFKLSLHTDASLSLDTYIPAANGRCISALLVFAHALSFFRRQALEELESVLGQEVPDGQIRWVITVPAIWRQHAKQFMRQAAYKAGLCAEGRREDLLIALEPEVASVYCHSLRMHELVHEGSGRVSVFVPSRGEEARAGAAVEMVRGTRYLVVDCGGGTVDITVHEVLDSEHRRLKEVYKASGGPYGSVGVDMEFVQLLCKIFGEDFVSGFRSGRPAAWINLMVAFEARKRAVCPDKASPLNIEIPVAFISEYKKTRGKTVEHAVKKYKDPRVRYTDDGMLRIDSELMHTLFEPTLDKITQQVEGLFEMVTNMQYLFLVGGFSESKMLQERMKRTFSDRIKVVIPQEVSLAILRGAVLFGLDPSVIQVRRSTMTYGVGVLNKFMRGIHPQGKLLIRDGREWCADIFDKFVTADQSVGVGETLLRRYTPARTDQTTIVLHLYCSHKEKVTYVTDDGVERCGTLKLTLEGSPPSPAKRREIQVRMRFGETEILASAVDLVSQRSVAAEIDFLS